MTIEDRVRAAGGIATRADLIRASSRAEVDAAVRAGLVVADVRGRYVLPEIEGAVRIAHQANGTLCLTSAALHHGWEVRWTPAHPHVVVPRKRRVRPDVRSRIVLHRADLHPDQREGIATAPATTLEMCLRQLPWDEALAVADSALRHGVFPGLLRGIALGARGPGAVQLRRVAAAARATSANPFESVLRAIALDVDGLDVRPQVVVSSPVVWAQPDLVDTDLRIVLEADSFEWHGDRAALDRDARRYNRLVADGWLVLRFSWEQVMFHADDVAEILRLVVAVRTNTVFSPGTAA